nr:Biofilm dispersion protein BdlA [Chlamydiota bacterium]
MNAKQSKKQTKKESDDAVINLDEDQGIIKSKIEAIYRVQATIELNLDGTIIVANQYFLDIFGYTLKDIKGRHHSLFVEESYKNSSDYKRFWEKLNRGEHQVGEFKMIGKNGNEIWIMGSYNPLYNKKGEVIRIFNIATDITDTKMNNVNYEGQIAAINKSQAVIEFNMDGTIITANDIFLEMVGYTLEEIQGKHHSMFVDKGVKNSVEYKSFWEKLNRGEFEAAEYKRIGKNGKEVWLQATYNPIIDLDGKPLKVVKYATDLTAQKLLNSDYSGQLAAISKSQAVIEFNMDGTIISANDIFLEAIGYTLEEIQGKHHSMFVGEGVKNSVEYKSFWEKLNRGEFEAGEYKRIGKNGRELWLQAAYNPIFDLNGKPFKV